MAPIRRYTLSRKAWLTTCALAIAMTLCGILAVYGMPNTAWGISSALFVIAMHADRQAHA